MKGNTRKMNDTDKRLKELCEKISSRLPQLVPSGNALTDEVSEAAVYSLSGGGKRLRPILMQGFYELCGGRESERLIDVFCTIELVHTFSLIHDDLPCMDDDDYRRGRLSCHKAYPEAIALLAGDALSVLPFEIISRCAQQEVISYEASSKLTLCLSRAIGIEGMIGGQVIDMLAEGAQVSADTLRELHMKKTCALISAACEMGCILADADSEKTALAREYAEKLGLAFQIRDDILDVIGSFEELGKPVGSDKDNSKSTYVTLYGIDKAQQMCRELSAEAEEILNKFDQPQFLIDLTRSLTERTK